MYFEMFGKKNKKAIIMLHGAMFARSLEPLRIPLAKEYSPVFVHMDGHGKEYDSRFEREKIVQEILDFIAQNNLTKPHIIGFSLGTQIALMLANQNSKAFDKVALISPLIDATDSDINAIKFSMRALAAIVKLRPFAKIASNMLQIENAAKEDFIKEMKEQNNAVLADDIMKERLNSADINFNKLSNDFYIATGLKDSECFINSAVSLKNSIKNSVLSAYPQCGHNIPITCYKRLIPELKNFFKQ